VVDPESETLERASLTSSLPLRLSAVNSSKCRQDQRSDDETKFSCQNMSGVMENVCYVFDR